MYLKKQVDVAQRDALKTSLKGVKRLLKIARSSMIIAAKSDNYKYYSLYDKAESQAKYAIRYLRLKRISIELQFMLISIEYE